MERELISWEISSNGSVETTLFPSSQAPVMLLQILSYISKDWTNQEHSGPKLMGCTLF